MVRRIAAGIAYVLAAVLLTAVMLVVHLPTAPGRAAVRDVANLVLASQFAGTLHIGTVHEISWSGPLRASGITLRDPQGRMIIEGGTLVAGPVRDLWNGLRRVRGASMPSAEAHVAVLRLIPGATAAPSIADAFQPRVPSPPSNTGTRLPGRPFIFRSLSVRVDRLENRLGDFAARAEHVYAGGGLETEPLGLRVALEPAQLYTPRTPPLALRGSFDLTERYVPPSPAQPARMATRMAIRADLAGRDLECHVEFVQDDADIDVSVRGCRATREVIALASGQQVPIGARIDSASARGHDGAWTLALEGAAGSTPIALAGTVHGDDAVADLTVRNLDLASIRADLPASRIDGTLHAERHGARFVLDTARLTANVRGAEIPPVHAAAHLEGRAVVLDELTAPRAGLRVSGRASFDHPTPDLDAVVHLDVPDVGTLPLVRGQVHGAAVVDAEATYRDGQLAGRFDVSARRVRAQGARAATARVTGTVRSADGHPMLDADVRASGVVSGDLGPIEVRAHVAGDPTNELSGRVFADGTSAFQTDAVVAPTTNAAVRPGGGLGGPLTFATGRGAAGRTRVDATFHARMDPDAIRIDVPTSQVEVRGARGTVRGEVSVPRGPGVVVGSAQVATEGGGSAEVTLTGPQVSGRFRSFPLRWVSRATGSPFPLTGTVEGDLDLLSNRPGRPHGRLTWTDGRLPVLGDFDLVLDADHVGEASDFRATVSLGPNRRSVDPRERQTVALRLRATPPANLGNLPGWIRGLRTLDATVSNVALRTLQPLLPPGAQLGGTLDAHAALARPSPGAPPAGIVAFDLRNVRLAMDLAQSAPQQLRGLIRRTVGVRDLLHPMRVRGAVCGTIERPDLSSLPAELDVSVAREVGEPPAPPPTACTGAATATRETLVHTFGSLRGPWQRAAVAALGEFSSAASARRPVAPGPRTRALLAATLVDVSATVGPFTSSRWPFTRTAGVLLPALVAPDLPGELNVAVNVQGPLLGPTIRARGRLHTDGFAALVGRDELDIDGSALIAPPVGGPLFGPLMLRAEARAHLTARTARGAHEGGSATVDIAAGADLNELIDPDIGLRNVDIQRFQLATTDFDLGRLRWSRENNLAGRISLRIGETHNPLTPISANATITDLQVRNQRAVSASVNAFIRNIAGDWEVDACASARGANAAPPPCDPDAPVDSAPPAGLRTAVTLPLGGQLFAMHPRPAAPAGSRPDAHAGLGVDLPLFGFVSIEPQLSQLQLVLAANHFRIDTISPFIETSPIVRVGGVLTAQLQWAADVPRAAHGDLHITDGTLDLERLGEPLRGITIDARADGRRLEFSTLSLQMGLGTFRGRGAADFTGTGDHIAQLDVHAQLEQFPAEQEGNVYGLITGEAEYSGTFTTHGHHSTARLLHASVRVPDSPSRTLQDLSANPDVYIVGETRPRSLGTAFEFPIDIDFETEQPVWVRRDDFAIGVRASGHVHYDNAGVALTGSVEQAIQQSWFEIFGKRFYFERLNIYFDGSLEFNPLLDIAMHLDDSTIGRINLMVTDRLDSPQITFSADRYPGASQSEILAMLVLGRRESRGAEDQQTLSNQAQAAAASLVSGIFLNVVSSQLRRNFEFLPTIIAEPGTAGPQAGRYGAGFVVGRFYFQGTYGAVQAYSGANANVAGTTSTQAQEFRGVAEWNINDHFTLTGSGGTSNRWGLDLFYTP